MKAYPLSIPILFTVFVFAVSFEARGEDPSPERRTLTSDGRERVFHLYVPASLEQGKVAPLLICFHGAGGNGVAELNQFRKLADEHQFLLAGPEGVNRRWNAGCEDEIKATGGADDVGFVRDLIGVLGREYPLDSRRIYGWGFSNGAALLHRVAAERPDMFTAIAAAGAAMAVNTSASLVPGPPVSILILVGGEDPMFGHQGNLRGGTFHTAAETAALWCRRNRCGEAVEIDTPVPFTRWTAPDGQGAGEVELWIVAGGGHTPKLSGKFDTIAASWSFLARQSRPLEAAKTGIGEPAGPSSR